MANRKLKELQRADGTLSKCFEWTKEATAYQKKDGCVKYLLKKDILYRHATKGSSTFKQLVVPMSKRQEVMRLAHEGLFSAHLGMAKTCDRLEKDFYCPGVNGDIQRYCRSCDRCQRWYRRLTHDQYR